MNVSRNLVAALGGALILTAVMGEASAQQPMTSVPMTPVPTVVIYPGDIVRDNMLTEVPQSQIPPQAESVAENRNEVVGKLAKRTLLPWRPIPLAGVGAPRAVTNGAEVTLFYKVGGLTIVTEAAAMQDGSVGDLIRVRNVDSGLTVSGVVQKDGSVRVGGG